MIYVVFILALIIWGISSNKETMFSDTTIGKLLNIVSVITAIVCVIIFIVKLFKFIF